MLGSCKYNLSFFSLHGEIFHRLTYLDNNNCDTSQFFDKSITLHYKYNQKDYLVFIWIEERKMFTIWLRERRKYINNKYNISSWCQWEIACSTEIETLHNSVWFWLFPWSAIVSSSIQQWCSADPLKPPYGETYLINVSTSMIRTSMRLAHKR